MVFANAAIEELFLRELDLAMTKALDEHGELSDRYKDLWAKKSLIGLKLISNMSFDNEDARWKVLMEIDNDIDQLSHVCIDLLAEHLQIKCS